MPRANDDEHSTCSGTQRKLNIARRRRIREELAVNSPIPLERKYGLTPTDGYKTDEERRIAKWEASKTPLYFVLRELGQIYRQRTGDK